MSKRPSMSEKQHDWVEEFRTGAFKQLRCKDCKALWHYYYVSGTMEFCMKMEKYPSCEECLNRLKK